MDKQEIIENLKATGEKQELLHKKGSEIRDNAVSKNVYFRGLVEFSNICSNDCLYCGIRKSNKDVKRFSMSKDEIMDCVEWCDKVNYGSIVLQSGELKTKEFVDFVEDIVLTIKKRFPKIGVTLCVGEQTKETYQRFFDVGAHRYLLRIETSNKEHYSKIHPENMDFNKRKQCLIDLKEIGYQVGTGVMIGSPYQTPENLAEDLLFFKEMDIDMVGMGPYVNHPSVPMGSAEINEEERLNLSLNMIATLRTLMPDINIASTTALQALNPIGRELGLKAGANVIMPIVTPTKYRNSYKLYEDKPCVNETSDECLNCITQRIKSTGLEPGFGEWGDSKHFFSKNVS